MTEKHSELSTKLVTGHKRDGRCKYSKQGKRELVEACLRPGVSVAGMALRHGVNANLLRKWIMAYQEAARGKPLAPTANAVTPQLLPVLQVEQPTREPVNDGMTKDTADGCMEIMVAAFTVRVRGAVDPRQLNAVLDCLAQRR